MYDLLDTKSIKDQAVFVIGKSSSISKERVLETLMKLGATQITNLSKHVKIVVILGEEIDESNKRITTALKLKRDGYNIKLIPESEILKLI